MNVIAFVQPAMMKALLCEGGGGVRCLVAAAPKCFVQKKRMSVERGRGNGILNWCRFNIKMLRVYIEMI